MTQDFDQLLATYDYPLPQELIAKEPAHPRDSARLMIYDRVSDVVSLDTFSNITQYLPKNSVLVFNETKVIPARMELKKATGGTVRALYLQTEGDAIRVMAEGHIKQGDRLQWVDDNSFDVISREEKEAVLRPSFTIDQLMSLLDRYGQTPLPPYMKDSPLTEQERRNEYQTVFAHTPGSVAAPTAGLHFTEGLITKITQAGHAICTVTLHVNLGTFAPLTEQNVRDHRLHTEHYSIDEETALRLNAAKKEGRPIVAVGTTVVRTLESAASVGARHAVPLLERLNGATDIFITDADRLHFVDHLITNFHVPKSSLLMLVSAMTGRERLWELYQQAIKERMRFFSFGDGMLIV